MLEEIQYIAGTTGRRFNLRPTLLIKIICVLLILKLHEPYHGE